MKYLCKPIWFLFLWILVCIILYHLLYLKVNLMSISEQQILKFIFNEKTPWLEMRNKPNFPCAFVRLKNWFCNELPSRAEGAFDALRVLFCKAVIYFLLMPTITMNPKSFWNRIRIFHIPTFFWKDFLHNSFSERMRWKC